MSRSRWPDILRIALWSEWVSEWEDDLERHVAHPDIPVKAVEACREAECSPSANSGRWLQPKVRIYMRKQESKEKRKKTCSTPWNPSRKRLRKNESFFLFFLVAFLVESVFSCFLTFFYKFQPLYIIRIEDNFLMRQLYEADREMISKHHVWKRR